MMRPLRGTARLWVVLSLVSLCAPSVALAPRPAHAGIERARRVAIMKGVVFLVALRRDRGRLVPVSRGSGTVITQSGHILTNNHVITDPKTGRLHDVVAVALTSSFDRVPKPTCLAFPKNSLRSAAVDLAVIKCVAEVDGKPLRRVINWPAIDVGSSASIIPGDDMYIVGYPGLGGMTITFTAGKVSGFATERGVDGRAWIKTDANIMRGVSGGAAFDESGKLVGVPTRFRALTDVPSKLGFVRPVEKAAILIARARGRSTWGLPPTPSAGDGAQATEPESNDPSVPVRPTVTSPPRPVPPDGATPRVNGGLDAWVVRRVLRRHRNEVTYCYNRGLRKNPALAGRVVMVLTIGANGKVVAAMVQSTTLHNTEVETCLVAAARRWTFPRPSKGGVVMVSYPLLLRTAATRTPPKVARPANPLRPLNPAPRARVPVRRGPTLVGRLVDAVTGRPVAGGTVVVLKPGVSVGSVTRDRIGGQMYSFGVSNSLGLFRVKKPLAPGASYAVVVMAQTHRAVAKNSAVRVSLTKTPARVNLGTIRLQPRTH